MSLVKDGKRIKPVRDESREERDSKLGGLSTYSIMAYLLHRHRVGLLISGYPTLAIASLIWFVKVN